MQFCNSGRFSLCWASFGICLVVSMSLKLSFCLALWGDTTRTQVKIHRILVSPYLLLPEKWQEINHGKLKLPTSVVTNQRCSPKNPWNKNDPHQVVEL